MAVRPPPDQVTSPAPKSCHSKLEQAFPCPSCPPLFCRSTDDGLGSTVLFREDPSQFCPCRHCGVLWANLGTSLFSLFFSWGIPLAITVAAVSLKKIGYDASDVSVGWCWINLEAEDRVLWMLLTGKLWEMLAYVLLPLLYLLVRKHINRAVGATALALRGQAVSLKNQTSARP